MKIHLVSLSPSCFANNMTLETTIRLLERLFRNIVIANYDELLGKLIQKYSPFLDQNRIKDFELLMLMYGKERRVVEIEISEKMEFESLCELNNFLSDKGFIIFHSKEKIIPIMSPTCGEFCFLTKKANYPDLFKYIEEYPVPPSQEIRLEKSFDQNWIKTNIYIPLLTSTSTVSIVDPFIGRELFDISDLNREAWIEESHWIYTLVEIFNTFKQRSLYSSGKDFYIHTAIRVDEEEKVIKTALEVKKQYLYDPNIDVKFIFYTYERSFNPPDEFPHDRYVLADHIGLNIGIGLDTMNPDDQSVRRETQLTVVGSKTMSSIHSQLQNILIGATQGKKRRIIAKRTI